MPPVDDPLARLNGRAVLLDVLADHWRVHPRAPSTFHPKIAGEHVDLYILFESVRALGGLENVTKRRLFLQLRQLLFLPESTSNHANSIRQHYERYFLPLIERLSHQLERTYKEKNLYTPEHSWLYARVDVPGKIPPPISAAKRRFDDTLQPLSAADIGNDDEFNSYPEATRAAIRARMNANAPEPHELAHRLFSGCTALPHRSPLPYLDLRNHILRKWYREPTRRLDIVSTLDNVPAVFHKLAARVFTYLEFTGAINFGAIPMSSSVFVRSRFGPNQPPRRHVAIVGAGITGLIAARQLRSFGVSVTVFEGNPRAGGRIRGARNEFSASVDMGAMIITGMTQNPLAVLARQTDAIIHHISNKCPLFDVNGDWVSPHADGWAEREYNAILAATARYRNREQSEKKANGMSLGHAFQRSLKKRVARRKERIYRNMGAIANDKLRIPASSNPDQEDILSDTEAPVGKRPRVRLPNEEPDVVLCHPRDDKLVSRLLRWHIANLEYACAADIAKVSLKHWDQDDPYGFEGDHVLLEGGFEPLANSLLDGLQRYVLFNSEVVGIRRQDPRGPVEVEITGTRKTENQKHKFDAVLVTVPLGVLKDGNIRFEPPLPDSKIRAIKRLGVGGLMKVAMEFKQQFWLDTDMFGALRETVEKRGAFYFFWSFVRCTGKPVLIGMVAEPAVQEMEKLPDEEIVAEGMMVLRRKYPHAPDPITYEVSRWTRDRMARGAYTNIPVGSSGKDYDLLAAPVDQNLFFAGEHTCRKYPTTCASGIISGLREAGRIAEKFGRVDFMASAYTENVSARPCHDLQVRRV